MMNETWYSGPPGRSESTGGTGTIQRNRDGVPVWSGEATLFEEYVEACLLYEQTVQREKRYLCGPRLASELRGPARRVLIGKPADWLSSEGGVRRLASALRSERGQPKVPELSELLQKYFRGTRRARGEMMGDFILRKSEAYTRAQQSMARYMKEQNIALPGTANSSQAPLTTPSRTSDGAPPSVAAGSEQPDEFLDAAEDGDDDQYPDWYGRQWSAQDWAAWNRREWNWREQVPVARDSSERGRDQLPEILPDFVQGWYLFMDSGLDVMERNVLHAELKGTFGMREVEHVLRKHWSDHDLKKRDAEKGRYMANLSMDIPEEDESGFFGELNVENLEAEGYSAEEIEILVAEESSAQQAMAAVMDAKRTLKDGRARQHAVKMSRNYYPSRSPGLSGSGSSWKPQTSTKGPIQCFRCGGPHRIADCKEKPRSSEQAQTTTPVESAPLVFLAEAESSQEQEQALHVQDQEGQQHASYISTSQVVAQGKAVIDGGATRTIGSITALEQVAMLNAKNEVSPASKRSTSRIVQSSALETLAEISVHRQPAFQCLWVAILEP